MAGNDKHFDEHTRQWTWKRGATLEEIADEMGLTVNQVRGHLQRALYKLKHQARCVILAREQGIIQ